MLQHFARVFVLQVTSRARVPWWKSHALHAPFIQEQKFEYPRAARGYEELSSFGTLRVTLRISVPPP